MNIKFKCILLLLFNGNFLWAQDLHLKGAVIDAQTKQPIAAATISIPVKKLYFRADNKGKFDIKDTNIATVDSIAFSCVGYKTQKLTIKDLPENGAIELTPLVNALKEVKVTTNHLPLINVGSKRKNGYESYYPRPGDDFAMYMEGSKNVRGTIQTVGFFLTKGHGMFSGGDVTAPFRIRIFDVDTNGMPGKELTTDSIIVSAKKEWAWFDADISAYNIQNPDSGFYATFSLLDFRHYKHLTKIDTSIEIFSGERETYGKKIPIEETAHVKFNNPRICFTNDEFNPSRSYFYVYTLWDNRVHWGGFYNNQSFMIRATIAPE